MKYIAIIHQLGWKATEDNYTLINHINIYNVKKHAIWDLYVKDCSENKLDQGEPFEYDVAIEIDSSLISYIIGDLSDPYDRLSIALNLLTIYFGYHLGMVRMFITDDNYSNIKYTNEYFGYGLQEDFLQSKNDWMYINDSNIISIIEIFSNLENTFTDFNNNSIILNSLAYYYRSWTIHFIEECAVNLAISLEYLFSPSSNMELSHQIAFNIASFYYVEKNEKIKCYKNIKKLYSLRSKIVHGVIVKKFSEFDNMPDNFNFASNLLKKIIFDKSLIAIFDNTSDRMKYLEDLVFN